MYCKNPHVLDPLRNFLKLPSNSTIRLYKNKIEQKPGWDDEILKWCHDEAKKKGLKKEDHWGGFVIDEMKIQENLEMVIKGGKHKIVGFVNLGHGHDTMSRLTDGNCMPQLATQVLQFIFLSDGGFRFPIAQFPSGKCTPSTLYDVFWKGVLKMMEIDFTIYWCILDGADCNRQFVKIHFKEKDPVKESYTTKNIFTGDPLVFIMDPKHNIKKIRNNIQKSNKSGKPRCLTFKNNAITWQQFKDAFNWDQENTSLSLHERLTPQHFDLDSASKMRNHLAEDVLNCKMLFLFKKYQEYLLSTGKEELSASLDSSISLLNHTSKVVNLFNDKLYITSLNDGRMRQLCTFHNFMKDWRKESEEKNNCFISSKLWFDLQCMCLGFKSMIYVKLSRFPGTVIKPAIINQDCVENHFCQIRSCNGQNSNPTYSQQESSQNTIRFTQSTISKKSNAGKLCNSEEIKLSSCSLPGNMKKE